VKITIQQAAEAVERAAINLSHLIETLEANPRRASLPDLPMRRSHRDELQATARLLSRLAPHATKVRALLEENQA
jgi:hypothetical protein